MNRARKCNQWLKWDLASGVTLTLDVVVREEETNYSEIIEMCESMIS